MDLRRRFFGRVSVSENGKSAAPQVEITQDVISKAELSDAVQRVGENVADLVRCRRMEFRDRHPIFVEVLRVSARRVTSLKQ